ncbi:RNase H family protein [Prescottella agglutinans]|uniref:RNase H type-1 domain-containing protein n=1 Tax=Prescottella agglutinans TaxID=1644129 RepID=A0ABT6MJS7_9NOCA|nr:RNase H family protein [Prescottella agglutinans]MDH6284569.1 hypothetical protein [Prescottella agglutinans]
MATRSPLQTLLKLLTLQASWADWTSRMNDSIPVAVIRAERPSPCASGRRMRSVAVVYQYRGTQRTEVLSRTDGTNEALVLDGFEWLYKRAACGLARTIVYVDHPTVRRELAAVADSFPHVRLADQPTGCLQQMVMDAGTALPPHAWVPSSANTAAKPRSRKRPALEVATDASKRSEHDGVGLGVVDAGGSVRTGWLPAVSDINLGEVLAIELAVKSHPGQRLSIATDSQTAINYLRMPLDQLYNHMDALYAYRVVALQRELELTHSRVRWVKGHTGHDLNEAAHRAALAARRNAQFNVPEHVAEAMYQRIGADAREPAKLLLAS